MSTNDVCMPEKACVETDAAERSAEREESFRDLGLREELLRALDESDHLRPTPIQRQAVPQALAGRDLICCAQTGTGKTAAFALPILQRLAAGERAPLRALVLVPTRELALQVAESFRQYGRYLEVVTTTAFGGVPIEPQERMLRAGVDVLVATPGRLKDHIWRGNIDFRNTVCLVLDEADRMLDMGFVKAVREIVELLPAERQSLLFSATLDGEIRRFARDIVRDPLRIEVAPPAATLDEVDQYLVRTSRGEKRSALEALIRRPEMTRTLIFSRTKSGASRLASQLRVRGYQATAIHSDRSQADRIRALEGFREGRIHFLVATDIAARGIDVDDVSHVINFDLPYSPKDYVHRIGRTARAGRRGVAISLITPEDLAGVAAIERLIARKLAWLGGGGPPPAPSGTVDPVRRGRRGAAGGAWAPRSEPSPAPGAARRPSRRGHGGAPAGGERAGEARQRRVVAEAPSRPGPGGRSAKSGAGRGGARRGPDGRGAESVPGGLRARRGPGHGPDGRGPGHGPDGRGAGRGPDGRGAGRGPDGRGSRSGGGAGSPARGRRVPEPAGFVRGLLGRLKQGLGREAR